MMSRRTLATGIAAGAVIGSALTASSTSAQEASATPAASGPPTVVLVHGAFADAASWSGVISALQAAGIPVLAPPNPLRGLSSDAAYIASAVNQVTGPVVLVGHSYGGAVNTVASAATSNVVALVYIAAFAPDEGETLLDILGGFPPTLLPAALRPTEYPIGEGVAPGHELRIDAAQYRDVFAADVPEATTAWLAVSQRPGADIGFGEPAAAAGWKTIPSWYLVATADQTIGAEALRSMATRSGATTIEVDASHSVAVSQPQTVADFILTAVTAVS